jgi:glutamate-1-semialdehyde 2,1-aminomutase
MTDRDAGAIHDEYLRRTPRSGEMMARASRSMPRGLTRTLSYFPPYPVVFQQGRGAHLEDVDGNDYVDLFSNGLSLMHGHAYEPIEDVLRAGLRRGTAWPGSSDAQIDYAELLCRRVPGDNQVRFANTGTEAMMLGVKLARHVSGKEVVVKAWHAYHGSYDDLEVGLDGRGEVADRVALATFGEIESYEEALDRYQGRVAAIIVEPLQYTGVVTPPPDGFLPALRQLALDAGALLVLDDCLMFRLAEGGSVERFGFEADITCLGKWIGGGLPVGVVAAPAEMMSLFDLDPDKPLYHGGSFNGNLLGMLAGKVALTDLTAAQIDRLEGQAETLKASLAAAAASSGLPLQTPGVGSVFGIYLLDGPGGEIDWKATRELHLGAVNHGVYYGSGGEVGINTATTDDDIERAGAGISAAMADLAATRPTASEVS